jgi:hypothetical protein
MSPSPRTGAVGSHPSRTEALVAHQLDLVPAAASLYLSGHPGTPPSTSAGSASITTERFARRDRFTEVYKALNIIQVAEKVSEYCHPKCNEG